MINITLLSQERSMLKSDLKRRSISVMLSALFSTFNARFITSKGLLALLIPLFMAASAMAAPIIQTQPGLGPEVCVTSAGSLTVVATAGGGGNIAYQWQVVTSAADTATGSTVWANITSGYSGTYSAPTLLVPAGASLSLYYRCVLVETGGSAPGTKFSRAGYFTVVNSPPTFNAGILVDATVCQNSSKTFTVSVLGPATKPHLRTYQWQVRENGAGAWGNGNASGGDNSATSTAFTNLTTDTSNFFTFTSPGLQNDDNDSVRVQVRNVCGISNIGVRFLVNPVPSAVFATSSPTTLCQSGSLTPQFNVTNAELSTRRGNVPQNWTITYNFHNGVAFTDVTGATQNGNGNGTNINFTANTLTTPAAGCYIWDITQIQNTSATPTCTKNLATQLQANVYPNPTVSFTAGPVDVCEGNTANFVLTVGNATYLCDGATTAIPWAGNFNRELNNGTGGPTAFPLTSGITGTGNGAFTYTTGSMSNGDWRVALSAFATTGFACPASTALPITKNIRAFPQPNAEMGGTNTQDVCQTGTITIPPINVTGAQWNGPAGGGPTNLSWSLNVSDPTTNIPGIPNITGVGNTAAYAGGSPAAPAVGCHIIKLNSITLTNTGILAPDYGQLCPRTISGQQKTFNVYPNPTVSIVNIATPIDVCEGSSVTFQITVGNATRTCNSTTSDMAWSGTILRGVPGFCADCGPNYTPSSGGTTISGSGNGTFSYTATVYNDDYLYNLTAFAATTTLTCATTSGLPQGKQVRGFPVPVAFMGTYPGGSTTQSTCANGSISIPSIGVTNTVWQGPGVGPTNMNWTLSVSDATGNLAGTYTGTGDNATAIASSTPAAPAAGCYTTKINSIALTSTAGATPNPPVGPPCTNTISGQQKVFTVYPNPVVTFVNASNPVDICEGSTANFDVTVSNATLSCAGGNLAWGGTFTPLLKGGGAGNFSIAPALTGSGNGSATYNANTFTLGFDDYDVQIASFALTSSPFCAATSLPANKNIRVFPIPNAVFSSSPTTTVCQSTAISTPTITVSNVTWPGPAGGSTLMNYSLSFTDGTGLITSPFTGTGPTVHGAASGTKAPGCYTLTLDAITLTNTGALGNPGCPKALTETITYTVNPEPILALSPAGPAPNNQINICEGSTGTFGLTVTNAVGCSGNASYGVSGFETFEAAANGSSVVGGTALQIAIISAGWTGSGNQNLTVTIPGTLAPGQYRITFTGITTTTPCSGTIASNAGTLYVNVYPKPTVTVTTAETVCEGTAGSLTFTVNNTYFDPNTGNEPFTGVRPGSFTYSTTGPSALGGTIPSSPITYTGSTGTITLPYITSNSLTAGTYTLTIGNITQDNISCTYAVAAQVYTLTVKKTPLLTINSSTAKTCLNTTATFNYTVSNLNVGDAWAFQVYSTTGFAGSQTVSGTIAAGTSFTGNFTTPAFTSAGTHQVSFTAVIVTSGTAPFCQLPTPPADVPVTIISLPQVTALTATTATTFCAQNTMSWDATVTNMVAGLTTYGWTITYKIVQSAPVAYDVATGLTVTGSGNGTFGFTLPGVQTHFDSAGVAGARTIVITKIAHTSLVSGTGPLCERTTGFGANNLAFNVEPLPKIDVFPTNRHVCVTSKGTVNYRVSGVRAGKTWSFQWNQDNPSSTPATISGSGATIGTGTASGARGTFQTTSLTNVTPTVPPPFEASGIYIKNLTSSSITCDSATSQPVDSTNFRVDPPSFADTLTPNYIKCEDNNSNVISVKNPSLLVGSIQGWDSSHDNGYTWYSFTTNPPGVANSNTFTNIRYTTQYRIRVKTPACAVAYSKVAQIFIDPRPKIQIVDNALTVCSGGNVLLTVLVSGVKSTDTWSASYTHTGSPTFSGPISGTGSGTFSFTIATGVTSGTHTIVLGTITNGITGCTNYPSMTSPSNTFTASVATASVAGNIYLNTITAGTMLRQTVCKGTTVTLRHGNHAGSVSATTTWFWSTVANPSYPSDWDSIVNNSSSLIVNTAGFPDSTHYMVRVQSGSCNSVRSAKFALKVRPLPTASFDAPRYKRICEGSSIGNALTVNGHPSTAYTIGYTEGGTSNTFGGTTNGSGVHNTSLTTASLFSSTNVIMQSIAYNTAPTCAQPLYTDAIAEIVVLKNPKFQMLTVDTPICIGNKTNYTYNIYDISSPTNLTSATTTMNAREDGASSGAGTLISGIAVSGNGAATKQTTNTLTTAGTRFITITSAQTIYAFATAPASVTCDTAYNSAKSFLVWPATVAGTISSSATVCKGANSGTVTATAGTGAIIRWESSINGGSSWSTINNTTTTQGYSNITVTTMFRAVYKSGNCAEATNASPVTITVNDLPSAAISITGTNGQICAGTAGTYRITPSNTFGFAWSAVVIEGSSSRTITGTGNTAVDFTTLSTLSSNTTISLVSIQTTSGVACGPNTISGDVTFTVTPLPTVTLNSVTTPVCAGASTFATFQITTSNIASGVGFTVTYSVGATTGLTYSNSGSGTFTVATSTPALSAGTTAVTLTNIATTSLTTNCNTNPSGATLNITVNAVSTAATVGSDATVCKGANSGTITATLTNGSVVRWEYLPTGASTWTVVSNTSTTLNFTNLTATTQFRVVTKNGSCAEINSSNNTTITVNEQPTAAISILSGNNPICANTAGTYRITVANTYSQGWSVNLIEGATARTVTGTGTTGDFTTLATLPTNTVISLVNISTTGSPSCGPNTQSGDVTFNIVARPTATLNSVTTPVCVGASTFASFQITTANIASGVGFQVTYSIGATTGLTYTNTGSGTFTVSTSTPALSTAGTYTVTLTDITTTGAAPNCNATPVGPARDIVVDATSVAGTVSSAQTVCKGANTGSVSVGGHNGSVVRWEYATTPFTSWTTVSNTTTTLSFTNLTATTQFRAVTKNSSCSEINSSAVTITVNELPTASIKILSGNNPICAGTSATYTVTIDTKATPAQTWSLKVMEGSSARTLTGSGNGDFNFTTLSTLSSNTVISLVEISTTGSPACGPNTQSGDVTFTVTPLPTVTLNSVTTPVCQGTSTFATFQITTSNIASGVGFSVTYSIGATTGLTYTNTGSGTFTVATSAPALSSAGTIAVTLTNITTTGLTPNCNSVPSGQTLNITVDATSVAGTVTSAQTVCKGANSGSVTVAGHNGSVVRWEYLPTGSSTWTVVSNTSTSLNFTNLTVTTQFRAVTKTTSCAEINSSAVTITVNELPTASISILSGNNPICQYTNGTYTITTNNTFGQTWSLKVMEGASARTLTGTGNTTVNFTTSSTLTSNTVISLVEISTTGSPACGPNTVSGDVTFTVTPLPTVTLNSVTTPVCQGTSTFATFSITTSNIASGVGFSVTYSVGATTGLTYTNTGSGTFTVATTTPALNTAGTVAVTLTNITTTGLTPNCNSTPSGQTRNITVDATSVAGTVSAPQTVCKGANSGSVSVSGHTGSVVRWEYLPTGTSTWTVISNTTTTLNFSNLTVTTQFRAFIKNSSCGEVTQSTPVTITVNELPTISISILSGNNPICAGTKGTYTVTVDTKATPAQTWSANVMEGSSARTITGSGNGSFNFTTVANLSSNTVISLVTISTTGSPACGPNTQSGDVTFTVTPRPTVTLNAVTTPVCVGTSTFANFQITTSNIASGVGFSVTYSVGSTTGLTYTNTGSGTFNVSTTTPALSTAGTYTVSLTDITTTGLSPNCNSTPTGANMDIVVDALSIAATVGSDQTICKGANSGSITASLTNGSVVRWEYLTAGSSTWTVVSNTSTTLNFSNITVTTQYRVVTKNSSCSEINSSNTVTITVNELPTVSISILSGNNPICQYTNGTYTVTTNNTYGQDWSVKVMEGASARTLTGTGNGAFNFTTSSTLSSNTVISLIEISTVSGVSCGPNTQSGDVTFTVTPLPNATLNGVYTPVCQGSISSFEFTVSNIATGQGWSIGYSEGSSSKTTTGNGPGTYSINTGTLSTPGNVIVTLNTITTTSLTPNCSRTLSGQTDTIVVDATTVAGSIAGAATVCKGSNSGTLTYSGGNGAIVRWEYSINSGSTWSATGTTASTFNYSNLTQTTLYRVIAKNSACLEAISGSSTITVRENPYATIGGSKTKCQNDTAWLDVTVSNSFGNPWTITYLEGTSTMTLSGSGDGIKKLISSSLATTTDFTLQSIILTHSATSSNPACGPTSLSSTATVKVTQRPTATLNKVVTPICQGNASSFEFTVSNIATGQAWSMNYTEGSSSKTTTGNGPGTFTVSTSTLGSGTTTITLNTITTSGLSPDCPRNLTGQFMDITVNPTTTVGTLGTDVTVCKNSNSGNLNYVVGSSNGAVIRWESSVISSSGTWSAITNTSGNQNYVNISQTTYYRVIVKSGTCPEKESNVVTISVQEIPVATIGGSSTICAGNTATLNISISNVAARQRSILTYLEGTTTKTINIIGTSGTITTSVLNTNTDITLVSVQSIDTTVVAISTFFKGCTNPSLTSTATVNVNALPTATLTSVGGPICQGNATTYTVTVTNVPTGQGWSLTGTIEGVSISPAPSGTGSGTFTFNTNVLNTPPSASVKFSMITNTTTGCTRSLSESKDITVDATTTVGTTAADATVCKGANAGSVNYTAGSTNGKIVRWEYSTVSPSTAYNGITNTATAQTYSNLTATTYYRTVVKNGACNEASSTVTTITVRDLPNATIAGNATICEGSSTNFTITVTNTFGQAFRVYYLIGSKNDSLSGTGDGTYTINTGVLTSTTTITLQSIRQISGTPQCNQALNGTITITVNDLPRVSYTSVPSPLCQGSKITFTFDVSKVKTSQNWTLSYTVKAPSSSGGTSESTSGNGSGTYSVTTTATVLPSTSTLTLVTITNNTTGCSSTMNDAKVIDVDPTSVGGSTSAAATVCKGSNTGSITVSGHTGTVVRWESSINNGASWSTINNTNTSLSYSNLTQTTIFRAFVMSGVCTGAFSATTTITVNELPMATINDATICAGNSANLSVVVTNTFGASWTLTFSEGSTTRQLTGTGNGTFTLTTNVLTATTTISLKSIQITTGTVLCSNTLTGVGVVTVNALPTATHDTAPSTVCDGSPVDFTVNVNDVVAGQGWTIVYKINSGSNNTKSGTGPGNFTITSPNFTNTSSTMRVDTIKIVSITNTTTGCVRTATLTRTIEVYPKSVGGTTAATVNPLCANTATTSDITVSGFVGNVLRWEFSDDAGTTWTTLSNTATTITVSNLSKTRIYRAVILSGPCLPANSAPTTITVIPTVDAAISGAPQICQYKTATFNVLVSNIASTNTWSLTYRVNGILQTAMTGTGPGNYALTVGPPTTNAAGTIVVKLETITNTTFNCANNVLSSQAIATVNPNPVANFTFSNACRDSAAVFNNTSTILSGTIADFNWNFGDGSGSKDGSPTHAYVATGNYAVSLLAVSAQGCRDSITKTITINPRPVADFSFKNTCQDTAVKFVNGTSIGSGGTIRSYFWNFGDGTNSSLASPSHKYGAAGTYTVTLTAVSNNGCASVKVHSVTVYILPEPNYVASPVCQNNAMKFVNASSIGEGTMTYRWDFAGQGNSTLFEPTHTFTGFGSFVVSLTATSNLGCVKTLIKPVTVWANPIANFTVADVCIGETSRFKNTSAMPGGSSDIIIENYWNFGDSTFSTGKDPLHTYMKDGIYSVLVRATSDKGCVNSVIKNAVVQPLPVVNISTPKAKFCDGDNSVLTGNSGMRLYEWKLNGAVVGTSQTLTVTKQGWYKLKIWAPIALGGCSNEDSIFITVWPLPIADAGRDTSIHKGQSVNLKGKGAGLNGSYQWTTSTIPNFLTPAAGNVANVTSKPDATITYILTVTDRNTCVDVDTVTITVVPDFDLKIHNVVTPNGDGFNDTWIIDNIEAYPNAEVAIINRYGSEVYKKKGYLNEWDGTKDAPGGENLPDGAYYYVITMEGNDTVYKGAINLIRSEVK